MMVMNRTLPIGIQSFESLRKDGYLYVDKTEYVYKLAHEGKHYFLSRPRRFGKSLFLSTLRAYFEGEKHLFKDLKIEILENNDLEPWVKYPVLYFDFNKKNYMRETALEEVLSDHLREWEDQYEIEQNNAYIDERFQHIIKKAYEATGKQVVILVDEYDKPLLDTISHEDLQEHNRAVYKGFFSTLKSYDSYLKFVFLTGVTKFSKVSIFSDLNHLMDISMAEDYYGICGMTEDEILNSFEPEIKALASKNKISFEECIHRLNKMYDGYHFCEDTPGIYNPFSLLNCLFFRKFDSYWFETGTPTFLVDKVKQTNYDFRAITEDNIPASARELKDYRVDDKNPVPLLYQTGYLTIKGYIPKYRTYKLGYPNDEVKYSFIESLSQLVAVEDDTINSPLKIFSFGRDLENADLTSLRDRFTALFASLPYVTDEKMLEQNFQNVIYIVFTLLGQFVRTEVHSAKGRADVIVETDTSVFIFEFKRDKSAQEALKQIADQGYAKPYAADSRKIYKIGANFDSKNRTLGDWAVE